LFLALISGLSCSILSGKHPYKFWSQFFPNPSNSKGLPRYSSQASKKQSKTSRNTVENQLDLLNLCILENPDINFGAMLLGRGSKPETEKMQLKFGFELAGFNPLLDEDEAAIINYHFSQRLKEFGTTTTFEYSSTSDGTHQSNQFRLEKEISQEQYYLNAADIARVRGLGKKNKRRKVRLIAFVTFNLENTKKDRGWWTSFTSRTHLFYHRHLLGSDKEQKERDAFFQKGFQQAWRYLQLLEEMGLKPRPFTVDELWEILSAKFGVTSKLGYYLSYNPQLGLREVFRSKSKGFKKSVATIKEDELHPTSILTRGTVFNRKWVYLSQKKRCAAVLVLEEKPAGFFGEKHQLHFMSKILCHQNIANVKLVTQISPTSTEAVQAYEQFATRSYLSKQAEAAKYNTVAVNAKLNTEAAITTQEELYKGNPPFQVALVVIVEESSLEQLEQTCRLIQTLLPTPATLVRENEYTQQIWLQATGITTKPLLSSPLFNRRRLFLGSEITGICNLVKTLHLDDTGIEFIAEFNQTPIYLNPLKQGHTAIFGMTGSGKSVTVFGFILEYVRRNIPLFVVDLPNEKGEGTYTEGTNWLGGAYFDISSGSNNILQDIDVGGIKNEKEKKQRIKTHRKNIELILNQLVLGSKPDGSELSKTIQSILPSLIQSFYSDKTIQARFQAARRGGLGSRQWADTPVLEDFLSFCEISKLKLGFKYPNLPQALDFIKLRLNYWINKLGNCINAPTSFDSNNRLITFALSDIQSQEEAEFFALSIFIALSRQCAKYPISRTIIDEASVLLKYPAFAELMARKCATGRRSGDKVLIATQDVDSIIDTGVWGQMILQNISINLIGKTRKTARESFMKYLKVPEQIIAQNESFQASKQDCSTSWLLECEGTYIQCKSYPSYPLLALTVNNPEEVQARNTFKKQFPNKFEWLSRFWRYYKEKMSKGEQMNEI
jgi:hypothetical protein